MQKDECKMRATDSNDPPMRRAIRARRRGFTLAHLLGVIVLLAIPATILFPIIATPISSEASKDDDAGVVPIHEQQEFIRSVAAVRPRKADLQSKLAVFRTWAQDTQGADITFSSNDNGRTLTACFTAPASRQISFNRARRLHWYYTYLRRAYLPKAKCAVLVVDAHGRMLAVCRGNTSTESRSYLANGTWLRWASAGLPFTQAMHRTVASEIRRLASETHRL
jgi:Tfp pilus assembly protein PilE